MEKWDGYLNTSHIKPKFDLRDIEQANGISVIEAARGSLYHNISIEKGKPLIGLLEKLNLGMIKF